VQISCALLCDAASVREGLLHVLGGGITRVGRATFPSPLGLSAAIALDFLADETEGEHRLEFRLYRVGHEGPVATQRLDFSLQPPPGGLQAGEGNTVTMALPVEATLPGPGVYRWEVEIDEGADIGASTFRVTGL
jgi:hypothetical protein